MDNNMSAIVSVIMIGIGFLNGMIVATLLDKYEIGKTEKRLEKVLDEKFELEQQIDELKEEIESERQQKDELVSKLNMLVRQHIRLPPPEGPLERSRVCSFDSEDQDFDCPISPEPNSGHKD
jgi:hypothetical protein